MFYKSTLMAHLQFMFKKNFSFISGIIAILHYNLIMLHLSSCFFKIKKTKPINCTVDLIIFIIGIIISIYWLLNFKGKLKDALIYANLLGMIRIYIKYIVKGFLLKIIQNILIGISCSILTYSIPMYLFFTQSKMLKTFLFCQINSWGFFFLYFLNIFYYSMLDQRPYTISSTLQLIIYCLGIIFFIYGPNVSIPCPVGEGSTTIELNRHQILDISYMALLSFCIGFNNVLEFCFIILPKLSGTTGNQSIARIAFKLMLYSLFGGIIRWGYLKFINERILFKIGAGIFIFLTIILFITNNYGLRILCFQMIFLTNIICLTPLAFDIFCFHASFHLIPKISIIHSTTLLLGFVFFIFLLENNTLCIDDRLNIIFIIPIITLGLYTIKNTHKYN